MNPTRITLVDLQNLHTVFRGYRSHDGFGWLFRGQADSAWGLLPRAGREECYLPNDRDLGRFNAWRSQAVAYCALPDADIEQLAVAQHHGLATRLLDWSMNPLVACYFACFELPHADGVVYLYEMPDSMLNDQTRIDHLTGQRGVFGYIPDAISPRVLNQKGLFTVHCDSCQPISVENSRISDEHTNLIEVVIPTTLKGDVMDLLEDYGIDRSVLFPDLDGLSGHINSKTLRMRKGGAVVKDEH
jgi:hypothetical protein